MFKEGKMRIIVRKEPKIRRTKLADVPREYNLKRGVEDGEMQVL